MVGKGKTGEMVVIATVLWALILLGPGSSSAGDLEPTAAPGEQGTYTLQDVYDRLDTGAPGTLSTATAPSADPADSRPAVNEIMGKAPALDDADGATASDVVEGKTFWGLTAGEWGPRTGSLSSQTVDNTTTQQPGGIYGAFNLSTIDTDLAAGNISKDVNIYGVVGSAIQASGDAAAANVLTGKTFSNDSAAGIAGTMPDNGAVSITPGTTAKTIAAGYHNGSGTVDGDTDLAAGNISKDVNIFGVVGSAIQASGDAAAANVLTGKTFSNDSAAGIAGTMPDNGAVSITPGTTAKTVAAGYHNGSGTVDGDADLAAGNILKDVIIFGVTGSVIQASGDAAAANVLTGKTFSNGSAAGIAGTMPDNGAVSITPGTTAKTVAAGYHNGSGTVDGDTDLAAGNIIKDVNIFGVVGSAIQASGDAAAANVLTGKTFSNGSAAGIAGTMPDNGAVSITPGTTSKTVAAGYHNGSGTVDGDADLVAGNILKDVEIFGVTGTSTCCDEAQVPKTGQTASYITGDDGDLEKGLALPSPRFTDNNDGTVTDNLTKLVWLKNATCVTRAWTTAMAFANNLYDGYDMPGPGTDCELSDNSSAGDWRLPNIKELLSLINYGYYNPALSNETGDSQWADDDPFTNVESADADVYWSSTTWKSNTGAAWAMKMAGGATGAEEKANNTYYVWPVRDGQ